MNKTTLNILLIEDSPEYAGLVQHWLSADGSQAPFVLNWTDSLGAGLNRLAQGGVDAVLLDLGLPDSDGADTYFATRAQASTIPVIILSAADSESLALRLIQEGAADYLVKGSCTPELLVRAVRYAVVRRRSLGSHARGETQRARVIGLLGAKGGVGTSTVACYLAEELRRSTAQEVLLADLDVDAGLVSFLMGVEPTHTLLDAVSNIDRLDRTLWGSIVERTSADLQIAASPYLLGSGELDAGNLARVLTLARSLYRWIIEDLGSLSGVSRVLLESADEVLLVTSTTVPGLYAAKKAVDALATMGFEGDRLRLIINQAEQGESLSGSELKTIFGIPVYARLPHDSQALHSACLHRAAPDRESQIGRQICNLTAKIAGMRVGKTRKNVPEFLSFVGRFRKTRQAAPAVPAE